MDHLHRADGPPKVRTSAGTGLNARLALRITSAVGTMWCAYVFTAIALVSLPATLSTGDPVLIVQWVAQTFLQLVLLSVIIVGQNISAQAADKRSEMTFNDAEAILKGQEHLAAQLAELRTLTETASKPTRKPPVRKVES